jgi:hypothetical protein
MLTSEFRKNGRVVSNLKVITTSAVILKWKDTYAMHISRILMPMTTCGFLPSWVR